MRDRKESTQCDLLFWHMVARLDGGAGEQAVGCGAAEAEVHGNMGVGSVGGGLLLQTAHGPPVRDHLVDVHCGGNDLHLPHRELLALQHR